MHKQAVLNVITLFGIAILVSIGVVLLSQVMSFSLFMSIMGVTMLGYFAYMFYCIERDRLNHIEALNKLKDTND